MAKPTRKVSTPPKRTKAAAKKSPATLRATVKKPSRKAAIRPKPPAGPKPLDLSSLPSESVRQAEKWICLACVLDVFTRHLGLAPKTAQLEIKRYTPAIAELYAETLTRPYFAPQSPKDPCPYCGAPAKWHARFGVYRIESGKATDVERRKLVQSLPKTGDQFVVLEEKDTRQHAFFEWLEKISANLNLDDPAWLRDVSRHYLARKEPKEDWEALFSQTHAIRRSRRLEDGWEVDAGRLFLNPRLFDELLLVQYLVSRSHKAGGLTLEGRYTLPELFQRLRNAGYLRAVEVHAHTPGDALEQLIEYLGGGDATLRLYHIVDRRDVLDKIKALKELKTPRPRKV
jgi:hypothetical protein